MDVPLTLSQPGGSDLCPPIATWPLRFSELPPCLDLSGVMLVSFIKGQHCRKEVLANYSFCRLF